MNRDEGKMALLKRRIGGRSDGLNRIPGLQADFLGGLAP